MTCNKQLLLTQDREASLVWQIEVILLEVQQFEVQQCVSSCMGQEHFWYGWLFRLSIAHHITGI